jgi:hypothetical protein
MRVLCKKTRSKSAILKKFAIPTPVRTKRTNRVDFFCTFTYAATAHLIIRIRFSYFSHSIFRVLV